MRSMTGYGKASVSNNGIEVEIEIKSVNSRFLDLRIYLPRELGFIENELRKFISTHLSRGAVELRVNLNDHRDPKLSLNIVKLKKYHALIISAMHTLDIKQDIPIEYLMNEPGVIENSDHYDEDHDLRDCLMEAVGNALKSFTKSVIAEGMEIVKVLSDSIDVVKQSLLNIEKGIGEYRKELYESMKNRIGDLLAGFAMDNLEQRLLQELAIYIDRYDVQEEINRLKTHVETFIQNLKLDEGTGKTLNFIVQEMHREANTLGSKYSTSQSFVYILKIKEEIEKCKEMVQNVA